MLPYLWLIYLPLLFLPNLGFSGKTTYGTLELSDYLVFPYILLVFIASKKVRSYLAINQIIPILIVFVGWALFSTILIPLRYGYDSEYYLKFGLLKLGKLTLYGLAGILTVKALSYGKNTYQKFNWSLLFSGVIIGISLFLTREYSEFLLPDEKFVNAYKAYNAASTMMAILICYMVSIYIYKYGISKWKMTAFFSFIIILFGFLVSKGRGGWLAAFCGIIYLIYKRGKIRTALLIILFGGMISIFGYNKFPEFKHQIDQTFNVDPKYKYNLVFEKFDEGGRLVLWLDEGKKLIYAPLLGAGFFHRSGEHFLSGESRLGRFGSHNFWLQIFLETGIIGGSLVLLAFWKMWRQSLFFEKKGYPSIAIPIQSALIAAFVGGMSGEYFYGGIVLFTLFIVYAPIGSLPYKKAGKITDRLSSTEFKELKSVHIESLGIQK